MNFKRLLICLVFFPAMSYVAYVVACGWFVEPDLCYTSYFRNDIPEKNNYYYSYLNYYEPDSESDKEMNIKEWSRHAGGKTNEEDVGNMIYGITLEEIQEISLLAHKRLWSKIDPEWMKNGMMKRIFQKSDIHTLDYLVYAKTCEKYAFADEGWNYAPSEHKHLQDSLLFRGLELYKKPQAEFIRLRYAFQVIRMAYYLGYYDDCMKFFKDMVQPLEKSRAMAKYWAMSFYAGALYKERQYPEAAYYFSLVFDRSPRYSEAAMTSFRWMSSELDTSEVAVFCASNYEKAVALSMTGFSCFTPCIDVMERVYELCAPIPYMETLLIREINKIEDAISGYNTGDPGQEEEAVLNARRLKNLAIRYAGLREVQQPALWYTAAAYLSFILREYEQASLLCDVAENEKPGIKIEEQLLSVRLLVETAEGPIDSIREERILPSIRWLLEKTKETENDSRWFFDRTLGQYLGKDLPDLFIADNQMVKAALCLDIASQFSSHFQNTYPLEWASGTNYDAFSLLDEKTPADQLYQMLNILADPGKGAFDQFLYSHCSIPDYSILEMIGTKHMRRLQFGEAVKCFEQLSGASSMFHLYENPFEELPVGKKQPAPKQAEFESKLTFASEMARLQEKISIPKPDPADLYRYATGLYQMSWYGNSWQLLRYSWSINDLHEVDPDDELYYYLNVNNAKEYFVQASEISRNKEFKARCLFMASLCFQAGTPLYTYDSQQRTYLPGEYFLSNPYFGQLTRKYRKTDFYKDAVTRCTYLSDFTRLTERK